MGDVARFLGIAAEEDSRLPPDELVERLDVILAGAVRFLRQIPLDRLDRRLPGRDRTYRELGYHVFRIAEAFLDVAAGAVLTYDYYADRPPKTMRSSEAIALYGENVRRRLRDWWETAPKSACTASVSTYFGEKSLHEVLERTAWHAGQHVRQIMMLLEQMGIAPDRPLRAADFAGLPMPEKVWDD